ncbi:sir2 family NAD-dependent protein deacetylase [Haloferula helveola]|uniref:Sir2 family NAD-dependent protein deacetylase n=1 Tax=Haloferula helveola TaxID=490095 RepID=A0ABM7RCL1_9BACT|nr:sir2 family NAD-dependent protein deacetylase [Haloferula helveola]
MKAEAPTPPHFEVVADAAKRGRIAVFLGAGVNYAQQPAGRSWRPEAEYLPTGRELSHYLAQASGFPSQLEVPECAGVPIPQNGVAAGAGNSCPIRHDFVKSVRGVLEADLAQVCQHIQTSARGKLNLPLELQRIFERDYAPTLVHDVLAKLPSKSERNRGSIFITTNYDTVMESALAAAGEPFDVVYYRAPTVANPVWLYHWRNAHEYYEARRLKTPAGVMRDETPITALAEYDGLPIGSDQQRGYPSIEPEDKARTLVVKIHGTVSPDGFESSSFVISQNDYIQFLRTVSTKTPFPTTLEDRLKEVHFLFVGYGLGDWNILAICQNLWARRGVPNLYNWAIQKDPSQADIDRWESASDGSATIDLFNQDGAEYAKQLNQYL